MYKRILIAAALASTLAAGSAMACSQGGSGMSGKSGGMMMSQGGGMSQGQHGEQKKHFVRKVIAAVSKTGIDSKQAQKVTDAINTFKQAKMQVKMAGANVPLDAFKGDTFDKGRFTEILLNKPKAMINAKGDLLEAIYAILDKEQRKIFTREFTAPMVAKTIKMNMIKGHMMGSGKGMGGSCK